MKLHSTGLNPRSPLSSSSDIRGPSHFLKPVLWGKLGSPPFIFLSLLLIPKTLHSFCFPVSAFCSILSGAFRRVYFFFFLFPLSVIHSFNSSTCTHPPGMASVFLLCLLSQGPVPSQDVRTFGCCQPFAQQQVIVGTLSAKNSERPECSCCPARDDSATLRKPVLSLDVHFLFHSLGAGFAGSLCARQGDWCWGYSSE